MKDVSGYWIGSHRGTNVGGLEFNFHQKNELLSGIATMHESDAGVYHYAITGRVEPEFKLTLHPQSTVEGYVFGVVEVFCSLFGNDKIVGTWQSPIGTSGEFDVTRQPAIVDTGTSSVRKNVFISYSHTDDKYLKELLVHLKPLVKAGLIDQWSDLKLSPGTLWQEAIEAALKKAQVAILLVSPEFLASDFIVDDELPPILEKSRKEGTRIIPVILKPCRFTRDDNLSKFQAVNEPSKPLAAMQDWKRDEVYDKIAREIEKLTI